MVRISVLHDALKTMNNAERKGKRQALVRPSSKVVIKFLQVMMKHGASGVRLAAASAGQQRLFFGISCDQSCTRCQQLGMLHTTSLCFHQPVLQIRPLQQLLLRRRAAPAWPEQAA